MEGYSVRRVPSQCQWKEGQVLRKVSSSFIESIESTTQQHQHRMVGVRRKLIALEEELIECTSLIRSVLRQGYICSDAVVNLPSSNVPMTGIQAGCNAGCRVYPNKDVQPSIICSGAELKSMEGN